MNSFDPLNPEVWTATVQDYLNKMLISQKICNRKAEALLNDGDTVNFPELTDIRIQSYSQGTDLDIDDQTAIQSQLVVNQSKAATFALDRVQRKQARANYAVDLAYQSSFQLKNNVDQNVINTGINGAAETVAGGTLSTSTIITKLGNAYAALSRNNAVDAPLFGIIDPERQALLTQTFVANGFVEADSKLKNQFVGRAQGFNMFVSNNLPSSVVLTMDTQPTAGDTITILGKTWTWIADGSTATAGQIKVGANVADAKAILIAAINGTTPPSAGDYMDIATNGRRKYQNAQISCSAFSGDDATITSYGKIGAAETFTAATNVFAAETSSMLYGRTGAISLAIQMQPELTIAQEPKQLVKNYITHIVFGSKIFSRDEERLVKMTYNV